MTRAHKIWLLSAGVILILILTCAPIFADEPGNDDVAQTDTSDPVLLEDVLMAEDLREPGRGPVTGTRYWMNFVVALVIVIGFIWLVAWGFRIIFSRLPGFTSHDNFRVLQSIKLTTQSSVFIVQFINAIYILSVTPHNVTVVDKIDDPEQVKEIIDSISSSPEGVNPHAFGTVFQKRVKEITQDEDAAKQKETISREKRHFKDTLERLKNLDDDETEGGEWRA